MRVSYLLFFIRTLITFFITLLLQMKLKKVKVESETSEITKMKRKFVHLANIKTNINFLSILVHQVLCMSDFKQLKCPIRLI